MPASLDAGARTDVPAAPVHFLDLDRDGLRQWVVDHGLPAFRAGQMLDWVYRRRIDDWNLASNLPKGLRTALAADLPIHTATLVDRRESSDGTVKLLLQFPAPPGPQPAPADDPRDLADHADGGSSGMATPTLPPLPLAGAARRADRPGLVECVLIPDGDRRTVCISTQVGCPVKCAFCASGLDGLQRSLTAGEIVEQIQHVRRLLPPDAELTNVVVMGMGEPLANYDALMKAVRILNAPWGAGLGARRFTISTVGLPSRIRQLAAEGLQVNLALSLHAPEESLRKRLIPWARSVEIPELMSACRDYFDATGREVTFEYILLGGVNDRPEHAARLADLARPVRANVNLIPFNPVPGLPFELPAEADVRRFSDVLERAGITTHVRRHRGRDIDAACGQLRRVREQALSTAASRTIAVPVPQHGAVPV